MTKAIVRATLLAFILPLILHAEQHILRNDLLNLKASKLIETMGNELEEKTGIHAYVVATNEHFPEKFNMIAVKW